METLTLLIGLLGGGLFALGSIPPAIYALRHGRSTETPDITQWLLFSASCVYMAFFALSGGPWLPFWFLLVQALCWGVSLRYRYFPRNSSIRPRMPALREIGWDWWA